MRKVDPVIPVRDLISPNRPWVHLLYLGMFFFGWLYAPPSPVEAAISLVAMAAFIGVYVFVMRRMDWTIYPAALASTLLGLAFLPSTIGGAVYFVFAAAMLGRLRFGAMLWSALTLLAITGVSSVWVLAPTPLMAVVLLGLGAVAAAGSAFAARNERQAEQAEATRARAAHEAAEAERQRIARDLHDLLGHTLSVVTLKAEIAERLIDQDRDRARAELQAIQTISRDALAEVREAVIGLRGRNLAEALSDAGQRLRDAGLTVTVRGETAAVDLPTAASTALAMVTREAVTNILRHAEASRVDLDFAVDTAEARLTVCDDGKGGADPAGGGLSGLRARLEPVSGTLSVGPNSAAAGTRIEARIRLGDDA
jgi:two-component system, NarL family, sensor histidine kinase DesK